MLTSGLTAVSTSSDAAVTLIADADPSYTQKYEGRTITIINEGTVAGFFSVDGGTSWARLPASASGSSVTVAGAPIAADGSDAVMAKRVAGGSNLTGLWAFAY